MSCLQTRVGKEEAVPKFSRSLDEKHDSTTSDNSQSGVSPAHTLTGGEVEVVNVGAPSLMLDASILNVPLAQPSQTIAEHHPVWIVSGLYMQGASWVREIEAKHQPSSSPRPIINVTGHFVQRPCSSLLPPVALRVSSHSLGKGLQGLVPVYQSRRKDTSLVVALHFDEASSGSTWTSTACILLEDIPPE
jgi:hypothetical protein